MGLSNSISEKIRRRLMSFRFWNFKKKSSKIGHDFRKIHFNKKCAPKLLPLIETKIWVILDIENSDFDTF
jgi:hypothetical protein